MADAVVVPLAEFIAINAGFSLSSDLAAQLLEGRHLRAPPTPPPQPPADTKPKSARRRRQQGAPKSPGLAGGAAGACAAQQTRLKTEIPTLASLAADGSASDNSSPRASLEDTESEEKGRVSGDEKGDKKSAWVEPTMLQPAPEMVDWQRAAAFAGTGVLFCGVAQFVRLRIIDAAFDKNDTSLYTAAAKTGVNQLLFSPMIRAASMVTITYHATKDWDQVTRALKEDFFEAQTVSYMVKPVSNMAAFALFPNHILAQAVVMRGVAFGYNVYYSYVTHKRTSAHDADDAERKGGAPATASDGHITVELCCDAAPLPPRRTSPPLHAQTSAGKPHAQPCTVDVEQATSACGHYDVASMRNEENTKPSSKVRRSLDGAPTAEELDDLRVIVARRRERWAEWENKQRRAARLRRERQQQAEQKRARGNCRWLTGVASTVGLSWA